MPAPHAQEAEWLASGGGNDGGDSGKGLGGGGGGGGGFFRNPFGSPEGRGEWGTRLQTAGILVGVGLLITSGKQILALLLNILFLPVALFNKVRALAGIEGWPRGRVARVQGSPSR